MILDRYFARRFIQSFLVITAVFSTLLILIDLIEQMRRFEEFDVGFGAVLQISLLNAPKAMSEILPLIMILSSVALFVGLARTSELVVTRATGRSGLRVLVAPVIVAAIIGGLAVTVLNPVASAAWNISEARVDMLRNGGASAMSISEEGLWLRQGNESQQSVVHATGYTDDGGVRLENVTILDFEDATVPVSETSADYAILQDGVWILHNVKIWPLTAGKNPEIDAQTHAELSVPTTLTRNRIQESLSRPSGISVYALPKKIRQMEQAGFATLTHRVQFQSELARPLFLVAMVLIGAAFTMRHVRLGGTGVAVLTSVLLGFAMYFMRNFAQILGENGQLPIWLSAWAAPFAALCLALGLLLHAEDG